VFEGAIVSAEVVEQTRANKVLFFHFKNKTRQAKKKGHHQMMTRLQINQIMV
jgi:ribosomal protein L21